MPVQTLNAASARNFGGVGELERSGFIPAGSAAERDAIAAAQAAQLPQALALPSQVQIRQFLEKLSRMKTEAEYDEDDAVMENDDAVSTVNEVIEEARELLKAIAATPQEVELFVATHKTPDTSHDRDTRVFTEKSQADAWATEIAKARWDRRFPTEEAPSDESIAEVYFQAVAESDESFTTIAYRVPLSPLR